MVLSKKRYFLQLPPKKLRNIPPAVHFRGVIVKVKDGPNKHFSKCRSKFKFIVLVTEIRVLVLAA